MERRFRTYLCSTGYSKECNAKEWTYLCNSSKG